LVSEDFSIIENAFHGKAVNYKHTTQPQWDSLTNYILRSWGRKMFFPEKVALNPHRFIKATQQNSSNYSGNILLKDNFSWELSSNDLHLNIVEPINTLRRQYVVAGLFFLALIFVGSYFFSALIVKKRTMGGKLQQTKDFLEKVFNNSLPMCVTNQNYEIIHKNRAYDQIFPSHATATEALKCYDSRPGPDCHTENCSLSTILRKKRGHTGMALV
jgi:hypothetical protein